MAEQIDGEELKERTVGKFPKNFRKVNEGNLYKNCYRRMDQPWQAELSGKITLECPECGAVWMSKLYAKKCQGLRITYLRVEAVLMGLLLKGIGKRPEPLDLGMKEDEDTGEEMHDAGVL